VYDQIIVSLEQAFNLFMDITLSVFPDTLTQAIQAVDTEVCRPCQRFDLLSQRFRAHDRGHEQAKPDCKELQPGDRPVG
jgi:hypothetical protein